MRTIRDTGQEGGGRMRELEGEGGLFYYLSARTCLIKLAILLKLIPENIKFDIFK